jgi:hypothetical protein
VKRHQGLLFFILLYIALDLSLPTIPGAFVFEVAESVESIQIKVGRGGVDFPRPSSLARDSFVLLRPRADASDTLAPTSEVRPPAQSVVSWMPRATLEPAPPAEDPH